MDVRPTVLLALVCLIATGCRQNPYGNSQVEAMRAEVIRAEDRAYAVESDYNHAMTQLNTIIAENNDLRTRLGMTPRELREESGTRIARPLDRQLHDEPDIDLGSPLEPIPERPDRAGTQPPPRHFAAAPINAIYLDDFPREEELSAELAAANPLRNSHPVRQASAELPLPEEPADEVAYPSDMRVTHIVLHPTWTTGHDFDHKAGDDGISVLLQPRNAENQFVPKAAEISVVVLDANQEQNQDKHVADWTVDKDEMQQRLKPSQRGYQFRLPWPDGLPRHNDLHLFVRYLTEHGEKLEADMELVIDLPGSISERWTPKSSGDKLSRVDSEVSSLLDDDGSLLAETRAPVASDETITMSTALNPLGNEPQNVASAVTLTDDRVSQVRLNRPAWRPTR